jgi:hypothetical protein
VKIAAVVYVVCSTKVEPQVRVHTNKRFENAALRRFSGNVFCVVKFMLWMGTFSGNF